MKKKIKITLFVVILVLLGVGRAQLYAIDNKQLNIVQISIDVGKTIKSDVDGTTFSKSLGAISLTESSAGRDIIGDDKRHDGVLLDLNDCSLGVHQNRIQTVRFVARQYDHLHWINKKTDKWIANKLLADPRFSAKIAGHYLKWNYDVYAPTIKRTTYKKRLITAWSRFNGGSNNWQYINRVSKNLRIVNKLIKEGKLQY